PPARATAPGGQAPAPGKPAPPPPGPPRRPRRQRSIAYATYQGLHLRFTAGWAAGQPVLTATLPGRHHGQNYDLDVPASYLKDGQTWRLLGAIDEGIRSAGPQAASPPRPAPRLR